ncbi:MAG TPA: hypothetical protein VL263_22735 [Vicinamibacterales bacterium]|nr:hypothetical protein [Vicinamibacterales bacterium]
MSARGWILVAVVAAAVLLVAAYAWTSAPGGGGSAGLPSSGAGETRIGRLDAVPAPPFLLVRSLVPDGTHGRVAIAPLTAPDGPRYFAPLTCERVFYAAGQGVCLTIGVQGIRTVYAAEIFDASFAVRGRVRLTGVPSRVRVAPDGKLAGVTVFEEGHSYAERGYSTRTTLIDLGAAAEIADLESFAVTRDGQPFHAVDFNFWGVTFTKDSNRFYATLGSGDVKYLVEGDVNARTARVVASGVECPSLSPDNTRIAYKKAHTDARGIGWTLHVLELETRADTALAAETRSVDDQVEWLDDRRVMYHQPSSKGADIWVMDIDGRTPPALLVPMAYSPAVVR